MEEMTLYQQDLIEALKDPREAAAYLNAALEDGNRDVILLALQNVAKARGGKEKIVGIPSLFSQSNDNEFPQRNGAPFPASFQECTGDYPSNDSDLPNLTSFLQSMGLLLRVEPEHDNSMRE